MGFTLPPPPLWGGGGGGGRDAQPGPRGDVALVRTGVKTAGDAAQQTLENRWLVPPKERTPISRARVPPPP